MADKEKVIKGLEGIIDYFLDVYRNDTDSYKCEKAQEYSDVAIDAIALLKAQEPRVLTLEEALVDNNNSIEISPYVFVGVKGRNDIFIGSVHDDIYGDYHSNDIKIRVYRIWMSDSKTYPKADYMKTVRFWNRKPTDEQRKAVKWDG